MQLNGHPHRMAFFICKLLRDLLIYSSIIGNESMQRDQPGTLKNQEVVINKVKVKDILQPMPLELAMLICNN